VVPQTTAFEEARRQRDRLKTRLLEEHEFELASSLEHCGEQIRLHCNRCGFEHIAEKRCSQKWCPVCVRKIATLRSLRYSRAAETCQWPLFVTLTRANTADLDFLQIRQLRRDFGKFRRLRFWSENVVGGVACIEVTNTGKGWHPHLHCLLDCEWLAIKTPKPKAYHSRQRKKDLQQNAAIELERTWSKCIGQLMSSVKVKRTTGVEIVKEVCKYAVKGSDLVESAQPIGNAIRAMQGTRLVTSFGSFYGKALVTAEEKKRPLVCPHCQNKNCWVTEEEMDTWSRHAEDKKRGRR